MKERQWTGKYSAIRKLINCQTGCVSLRTKHWRQSRLELRSQPSSPTASTSVTVSANVASSNCLAPRFQQKPGLTFFFLFPLRNRWPESEFDFFIGIESWVFTRCHWLVQWVVSSAAAACWVGCQALNAGCFVSRCDYLYVRHTWHDHRPLSVRQTLNRAYLGVSHWEVTGVGPLISCSGRQIGRCGGVNHSNLGSASNTTLGSHTLDYSLCAFSSELIQSSHINAGHCILMTHW